MPLIPKTRMMSRRNLERAGKKEVKVKADEETTSIQVIRSKIPFLLPPRK
jgi:hypothetical protein